MFCVWVLRANWQSTETGRVCSRNLSREVIFKQGNLGRALRLAESASPGAQIWGKENIGESTEVFAWSAAKFLIGEQERARCHICWLLQHLHDSPADYAIIWWLDQSQSIISAHNAHKLHLLHVTTTRGASNWFSSGESQDPFQFFITSLERDL